MNWELVFNLVLLIGFPIAFWEGRGVGWWRGYNDGLKELTRDLLRHKILKTEDLEKLCDGIQKDLLELKKGSELRQSRHRRQ